MIWREYKRVKRYTKKEQNAGSIHNWADCLASCGCSVFLPTFPWRKSMQSTLKVERMSRLLKQSTRNSVTWKISLFEYVSQQPPCQDLPANISVQRHAEWTGEFLESAGRPWRVMDWVWRRLAVGSSYQMKVHSSTEFEFVFKDGTDFPWGSISVQRFMWTTPIGIKRISYKPLVEATSLFEGLRFFNSIFYRNPL